MNKFPQGAKAVDKDGMCYRNVIATQLIQSAIIAMDVDDFGGPSLPHGK